MGTAQADDIFFPDERLATREDIKMNAEFFSLEDN